MKRWLVLLILLCLSAESALAAPWYKKPFDWAAHHKRFLIMESAAIGATVLEAKGMNHCRQGDVAVCYMHYGSGNAGIGIDAGLSIVLMPALAAWEWKDEKNSKLGYAIGFAVPAYQAGQGIKQYNTFKPKEKE